MRRKNNTDIIKNFSRIDQENITEHAEIRCLPKMEAGMQDSRINKDLSRIASEKVGVRGEYAVGLWLGEPVNTYRGKLTGDGGHDFTISGKTIQVKTTYHENGHLMFPSIDHLLSDVAILCYSDKSVDNYAIIIGWILRSDFRILAHPIVKCGIPIPFGVRQDQLHPPVELARFLVGIQV